MHCKVRVDTVMFKTAVEKEGNQKPSAEIGRQLLLTQLQLLTLPDAGEE
jgi:hypothetical protein